MKFRKLIALWAAVVMVVSMMPLSVLADMGGDFPWTDENQPTLIEQILARDGFIDGIWFPWFNGGTVGHNLTSNELMATYYDVAGDKDGSWLDVELDTYGADKIYREIYNLKAMGYNVLAYGGSIMAEGVEFDANGDVIGIKQEYLDNARRLLDMCKEIGMPVMWNVYFHCSSMPEHYGVDGWKVMCQMLGNNDIADHYAERFVRPLCRMLAEYTDVVALVSIADEPENEINDIGIGDHFGDQHRAMYGVNQDDMVYFMQQINEAVRDELPDMPRTVASNNGNKSIYRDFDLDLVGHNEYTNNPNFKTIESMITDADMIMTEYNVGNYIADDTACAKMLIDFRKDLMAKGYKGGFQWCWMTRSFPSDKNPFSLQRSATDPTAFRKTVSLLRYYMDEYRAEYRGETLGLMAPVLYANAGDGVVKFIPSEKATKITIQRSDDGGATWKNLATNVNQASYVDEYLIGEYTDSTARPAAGYCYRIIATDGTKSVTSAPNNVAGADTAYINHDYVARKAKDGIFYQPTTEKTAEYAKLTSFGVEKNRPAAEDFNLIRNGGFETVDGQWNVHSFLQYASVVEDATTPDGGKSLYFNTSAQGSADWYTFTVEGLNPNTDYTFSAFIKGGYLANDNKGFGSIGVIDPDTHRFMVYWENYKDRARSSRETQQIYPTAWDDEWHLRAVSFNSGDATAVTIALYGYSSQMWVDGIALFESANGVKYNNGASSKAILSDKWEDLSATSVNAVADPAVDNPAYWMSGAGYKQGFMDVSGGALAYTNSAAPCGVRYTKWISVKPNTDYYYSFTVNVTSAGDGRFALLDNAKRLPHEVVTASFASVGTKTYTGRISTGKYAQLGLCVVDLGGLATIDAIHLYEAGESKPVITEPSFDGYIVNGDFEIGSVDGWENLWNSNVVQVVSGHNSEYAIRVEANQWTHVRQFVAVEPNTDYVVELWTKDAINAGLIIKDGADTTNIRNATLPGGSVWQKITVEFNSGAYTKIILTLMGNTDAATYTVDNIKMRPKHAAVEDGFIANGSFEAGNADGWENLYDGNTITIVEGHNSRYAMQVTSGEWKHVRQKGIAVQPNTDYVVELWSKNAVDTALLIKDGADTVNVAQETLPYSTTWTKTTLHFHSGNNSTIILTLMGNTNGASYIVDDVTMYEKPIAVGLLNGDFEDGERYWNFNSGSHAIVTDAHGGDYALQLSNPIAWGEAAVQTITVEPETFYTITWWYKASYGTGIFNLLTMSGGSNIEAEDGDNFMKYYNGDWQRGTYRVYTDGYSTMLLKFTSEQYDAGTILIDDVTVKKTCFHTYDNGCDDTCNVCGEVREVWGHEYDERITQEPTCVSKGVYTYVCRNCDHSYTEEIPATGVHRYTSSVTKQPTCGATGVRTYTCRYCDYSYTETIPATGSHTYSNACDSYCNGCYAYRTAPHSYSGSCDTSCNLCGKTRVTYTQHIYDNACDADCNVCGITRSVNHYYELVYVAEPNCGNEGYEYYECPNCYDWYEEILPITGEPHVMTEAIWEEPTCSVVGEKWIYCIVCDNYGYWETIPATGQHVYATDCDTRCASCGEETRPEAMHTWAEDGCAVCHERLFNGDFELEWQYWSCWDEIVDQHQIVTDVHSGRYALQLSNIKQYDESAAQIINVLPYTTYTISWWYKAATGTDAFTLFVMNTDGWGNLTHDGNMSQYTGEWQQKTVVIHTDSATSIMLKFSTGIEFNDGTILIDDVSVKSVYDLCDHRYEPLDMEVPTCTEAGGYYYECPLCGHSYWDVIEALGHEYEAVETESATCEKDGAATYACTNCGDRYTEVIPAVGHTAGAAADCENAQTCTVCGAELQAALGHRYDSVVTAPDCENEGYTTHTCANCGDSYVDSRTDALGHTYDNTCDVECNVCGAIREVAAPIVCAGKSVSADVNGLAMLFNIVAPGMAVQANTKTQADYTNAHVTIEGMEYRLKELSVIARNGAEEVTIEGRKIYSANPENDLYQFAFRITQIPEDKKDIIITMIPYCVLLVDGEEITIYGEEQAANYNDVLQHTSAV